MTTTPSPHKRQFSTTLKQPTASQYPLYKRSVEDFIGQQTQVSRLQPLAQSNAAALANMMETDLLLRKKAQTQAIAQELMRQRTMQELEKKVEVVLKHNSHLLAENASLSELLADKNTELEELSLKLEAQLRGESTNQIWVEVEKKRLLEDFEKRSEEHNAEVHKLLDEISKLHDQLYEMETAKNLQITKLKETYEKETFSQIQNLKRSQNGSIELYETQVRKLKETLEAKNYDMENMTHQNKMTVDKLSEEINHLKAEIKHMNKIRQIELDECRTRYENEMHNRLREAERKQEIETSNIESTLRKMKKELGDKSVELERLTTRLGRSTQENETETQILRDEKERLKMEISMLEQSTKEHIRQEKDRVRQLAEQEIQNLGNANTNYTNSLKSEIEKLYDLCECKTDELKKVFDQLSTTRQANKKEVEHLTNVNEELRARLEKLQLSYNEDLELLKIKMAQLHQADVASLKEFTDNQLRTLAEQLRDAHKLIAENRAQLHKELQDKNEQRKQFEIQLSKMRSKNQDLKVKLAAVSVEFKEQLTSMTSKMELTSQTLLREAELKTKGQAFHDEEKRKLHHIVNSKDREITDLSEQIDRLKAQREADVKLLQTEVDDLRRVNAQLQGTLKRERGQHDSESKKRESKSREEIDHLKQEIQNMKTVEMQELKDLVDKLQKDNLRLAKELHNSDREHKQALQELGLRAGFVETMQLQSSAAIEEERNKVKVLMNQNEVTMRQYFEDKLATKNKEIQALKEQLKEKDVDLRDVIGKYHELEKRLKVMLEAQEKLRDFENRVLNLGMDNNLVKNMNEYFRARP